jgi:hypothetical protein
MDQLLFYNKIHKATVCLLLIMSAVSFSIVSTVSVGSAITEAYESGYDHGCDDAGIADLSERYINQPGKGFPMNLWTDIMTDSMSVLPVQIIPIVITPTTSSMGMSL